MANNYIRIYRYFFGKSICLNFIVYTLTVPNDHDLRAGCKIVQFLNTNNTSNTAWKVYELTMRQADKGR